MMDPTLNPAMNNNTLNNSLATLQGLNEARKGFLANQALQAQVPYAGPQAGAQLAQTKAQTGLIGAQTAAVPYTSAGALLSGIGRAIPALSPFGYLRNAPDQVKDVAAANQITGKQNIGNVPIPNYSGLLGGVGGLLGHILGGGSMGANPMQSSQMSTPVGAQLNGATSIAQPSIGQPLPLSPQQIQRTGQFFGSSQVQQPGIDDQATQLASNLNQTAQNKVASPALQQKYNYATNLMTTLTKYGNPAITFAKYMGPTGYAQYGKDLAAQDPQAINFKSFLKNVGGVGADQVRQFFSTSVQPSMMEDLRDLTNPQTLTLGAPGAAKSYDDLMDILRQEGGQAALSVGQQAAFNKKFPAMGPQDYLNNINGLKKAGTNARTYFLTLPQNVQNQIRELHQGRQTNG